MKYKNFFATYEKLSLVKTNFLLTKFLGILELFYYLRGVMVYQNFFATYEKK